jgi:hypothetical protein
MLSIKKDETTLDLLTLGEKPHLKKQKAMNKENIHDFWQKKNIYGNKIKKHLRSFHFHFIWCGFCLLNNDTFGKCCNE